MTDLQGECCCDENEENTKSTHTHTRCWFDANETKSLANVWLARQIAWIQIKTADLFPRRSAHIQCICHLSSIISKLRLTQSISYLWTNCFFIAHRMQRAPLLYSLMCDFFLFLFCTYSIFFCCLVGGLLFAVTCIVKIIYYPCETYNQGLHLCYCILLLLARQKITPKKCRILFTKLHSHCRAPHSHSSVRAQITGCKRESVKDAQKWRMAKKQKKIQNSESIWMCFFFSSVISIQFRIHISVPRETKNGRRKKSIHISI